LVVAGSETYEAYKEGTGLYEAANTIRAGASGRLGTAGSVSLIAGVSGGCLR
jgi:hypothetical protein